MDNPLESSKRCCDKSTIFCTKIESCFDKETTQNIDILDNVV